MNVLGLDLSITATGVARPIGLTRTIAPRRPGDARLLELRDELAMVLDDDDVDLVVIEGPVLRSQAAIGLAMLHGVVRVLCWDHAVPFVIVPPATLKKYATGRGNATKPDMAVAAFKRRGVEFPDDNQCDAAWLRWMGLDATGDPAFDLPADQRAAMGKVAWPEQVTS